MRQGLSTRIGNCTLTTSSNEQAQDKPETSGGSEAGSSLVWDGFKEAIIDSLNTRPVPVVAEEMRPLRSLEKRYGVNRTSLYCWRRLHGHNTRFTGRPKSLPPNEWKQLDRFVVFLSQEPWGFAWNKEDYECRFLDSEEYDETGNPLDYFQKIDRWVLANRGMTFDEYLNQLERDGTWPLTFDKSARN